MDKDISFWQTFVATVLGNLVTVWFLYGCYRIHKAEQMDRDEKIIWRGAILAPLLFTAGGIWIIWQG